MISELYGMAQALQATTKMQALNVGAVLIKDFSTT